MNESQSDFRFIALTRLVNELREQVRTQGIRTAASEQQVAQIAGTLGGGGTGGGGENVVPAAITSNVTAGSEASPSTFSATLLVNSGTGFTATGGTAVTGYNRAPGIAFTVSGSKSAWLWKRPSDGKYYLVSADC